MRMEVELNSSTDNQEWINAILHVFAKTRAIDQCATLVIGDQEIPFRFGPQCIRNYSNANMAIIKCELFAIRK